MIAKLIVWGAEPRAGAGAAGCRAGRTIVGRNDQRGLPAPRGAVRSFALGDLDTTR